MLEGFKKVKCVWDTRGSKDYFIYFGSSMGPVQL